MVILNYLSVLFLLIASGSSVLQQSKNRDAMIERTSYGGILYLTSFLLPLIMIMFNIIALCKLEWYWSLILAIIINILTAVPLANIYHRNFGYKSKPFYHFMLQKKDYRASLHYKDYILAIIVGIIAFIVSLLGNS